MALSLANGELINIQGSQRQQIETIIEIHQIGSDIQTMEETPKKIPYYWYENLEKRVQQLQMEREKDKREIKQLQMEIKQLKIQNLGLKRKVYNYQHPAISFGDKIKRKCGIYPENL